MKKKPYMNRLIIGFLTITTIIGIGASGFLYIKYRNAQNIINNPNFAGQTETKDLVKKISRLMLLPENEQPTLATVSDYKKLKDQPFFKNSRNGDKVLIYTKAKLAILYDPKLDKILAVAPLNIGSTSEVAGASTVTPIRIALYNGTKAVGLTSTIEQQLKSKINNVVFSLKKNAKNTYTKTLVVDLTGNQQKAAADLAGLLSGEIGNLPQGETAPVNTDFLIILGK